MYLVIGKVDWKNWEKLWLDPGIQLQFASFDWIDIACFCPYENHQASSTRAF